jgi:hypothetical protein
MNLEGMPLAQELALWEFQREDCITPKIYLGCKCSSTVKLSGEQKTGNYRLELE